MLWVFDNDEIMQLFPYGRQLEGMPRAGAKFCSHTKHSTLLKVYEYISVPIIKIASWKLQDNY